MLRRLSRLMFVMIALMSAGVFTINAQDHADLAPFSQTLITLDADQPSAEFWFTARADQPLSFSLETITGDLNPFLTIYAADGEQLAANDDESRRSQNARLEAWLPPQDGRYRLVVGRYGDERARTNGTARLTFLSDANSRLLSQLPIGGATLNAGQTLTLASGFRPNQSPSELRFNLLIETGDSWILQMRSASPSGINGWQLTLGETLSLYRTTVDGGEIITTELLYREALSLGGGAYHILLEPQRLHFLNPLGGTRYELAAPAFFEFLTNNTAALVLLAPFENSAALQVGAIYATAPFYTANNPPNLAVPPPSDENFLYDYAASPQIAIRELRELGYLPQGGGLALAIPDALIETSDAGFSSLPLQVGAGFENFALGFRVSLRGDAAGAGAACGLIFRQSSRSDFSSVLLADEGNAYLLDYSAGGLNEGGLALATPFIDPSPNAENDVLLIVRGEEAHLFINGVMIGTGAITARRGTLLLNIVLPSRSLTRCLYSDLWLWDLDARPRE